LSSIGISGGGNSGCGIIGGAIIGGAKSISNGGSWVKV